MNINALVAPYHLQKLVESTYHRLDTTQQKFLTNMLVLADTNGKISQKQAIWLESLITKMKKINSLQAKQAPRKARVNHDDHEIQVRPGKGPHPGQLYCVKCNKHIQWITKQDYQTLTEAKI